MSEEPDDFCEESDDCFVICPYCKAKYQAEAEDYSQDEREETCFICKRVYLLHDECTITHYTRKP
ncbi:MAG: hypothetical protein E6R03_10360 [Hyphomicrobiaceae bacterium]|nr:MAG: hypothetical protein E6R03_10360 [Hyphomicrobiaceae bacterium]